MISVFTAFTGDDWLPLSDLVLPVLDHYCQKKGYDLTVHIGPFGDTSMAYPMQKTAAALDHLEKSDCEFLAVLDMDILITNPAKFLEDFTNDEQDIFIGRDTNGLNSGVFLCRNSDAGKQWLRDTLSLNGKATSENHAMQMLCVRPEYHDKVCFVERLNQIPYERYPELGFQDHPSQYMQGDILCHLPGMTPNQRVAIFKEMLG